MIESCNRQHTVRVELMIEGPGATPIHSVWPNRNLTVLSLQPMGQMLHACRSHRFCYVVFLLGVKACHGIHRQSSRGMRRRTVANITCFLPDAIQESLIVLGQSIDPIVPAVDNRESCFDIIE